MARYLVSLPLFFLACAAYADVAPAEAPAESSMVGTLVFIVLFVGACAGFAWMIYKNENKKPK